MRDIDTDRLMRYARVPLQGGGHFHPKKRIGIVVDYQQPHVLNNAITGLLGDQFKTMPNMIRGKIDINDLTMEPDASVYFCQSDILNMRVDDYRGETKTGIDRFVLCGFDSQVMKDIALSNRSTNRAMSYINMKDINFLVQDRYAFLIMDEDSKVEMVDRRCECIICRSSRGESNEVFAAMVDRANNNLSAYFSVHGEQFARAVERAQEGLANLSQFVKINV